MIDNIAWIVGSIYYLTVDLILVDKIITQLNAKQIANRWFDCNRNTVKAHGLQSSIKFFDSFHPDLTEVVYYQAVADGIFTYQMK